MGVLGKHNDKISIRDLEKKTCFGVDNEEQYQIQLPWSKVLTATTSSVSFYVTRKHRLLLPPLLHTDHLYREQLAYLLQSLLIIYLLAIHIPASGSELTNVWTSIILWDHVLTMWTSNLVYYNMRISSWVFTDSMRVMTQCGISYVLFFVTNSGCTWGSSSDFIYHIDKEKIKGCDGSYWGWCHCDERS